MYKQQRPEPPTVTLTWHARKYKVHKLLQRYIVIKDDPMAYFWYISGILGDKGVHRHKTALMFVQD